MRDLSEIFEPVCSVSEIAELERLSPDSLMERAGLAVAEFAREIASKERVLVLAGPGNNGGDAFVAARHLKSWWFDVALVFAGSPERLPPDAARAHRAWLDCGGGCVPRMPGGRWDLAVDGLFGTGLNRALSDPYPSMIDALDASGMPVLSIDIPSGICPDTGTVLGSAVVATHTLTFIALKPGLLTSSGLDHCGHVRLDRLGLVPTKHSQGWAANSNILRAAIGKRPRNSHKGLFGSTAIVGGSSGMAGAAILAARAALKMGAGKVILGALADFPVDAVQPEIMVRDAATLLEDPVSSLVIGPGLGHSAHRLVELSLGLPQPLVVDADALNLIAAEPELQRCLIGRSGNAVLTPHPAEAARLMGCATADIQGNRILFARRIAEKFGCPVVLKGAGSICAFPSGEWAINTSGNPGLASAGMGDVLSGMIGAFLSQGLSAEDALLCAVHLHGAASDSLSEEWGGEVGMTATEVIDRARALLNGRPGSNISGL